MPRRQVTRLVRAVRTDADPAVVPALAATWAVTSEPLAQRAVTLMAAVPHRRSLDQLSELAVLSEWGTVRAAAAAALRAYDTQQVVAVLADDLRPKGRSVRSFAAGAAGAGAGVLARRTVSAASGPDRRIDDEESHRRALSALRQVTGADAGDTAEDWFAHAFAAAERPYVDGDTAVETVWRSPRTPDRITRTPVGITQISCFAAGTLVWTDEGPAPIDRLLPGDLVLSIDVDSGELQYRPVIERTMRPRRRLVSLSWRGETVRTTPTHRFWAFSEGWRPAGELKPGDLLRAADGLVAVEASGSAEPEYVYNLIVQGNANYFVGDAAVLVHDFRAAEDFSVRAIGQATYATRP